MKLKRKIKRLLRTAWRRLWGGYKTGGICGAYHWLRCHLWHRYHIVNLSGQDGYRWGWIDRDHAMYLACFALLMDFVENEDPRIGLLTLADYKPEDRDWFEGEREMTENQLRNEAEVRALYEWWTHGRAEKHRAHEEEWECNRTVRRKSGENLFVGRSGPAWEAYCQRKEELEAEDDEMLLRLIKIRKVLWT